MGIVLHLNRTGPTVIWIEQRRKQRAPPPAAAAAVMPASAVLALKRASQASSEANETSTTFDLTHKHDKSNIIYQKLIKNWHPDKIKSAVSNILIIYIYDR
jgi:hypothetical protein